MKKDDYWREPKNVKKGWWYANDGSIDVISTEGRGPVRIPRSQLVEYIRRTGGMNRSTSTATKKRDISPSEE